MRRRPLARSLPLVRAALAALVVSAAVSACGRDDEVRTVTVTVPAAPAVATATTTTTSPPASGQRPIVLVGDSLSVPLSSRLPLVLPDWKVSVNALGGRTLAQGMEILASIPFAADGRTVLAMGLSTNDNPARTAELEAAVRESLRRVGPKGCVLWATIAKPMPSGPGYEPANQLLARMAAADRRLRIVPWELATRTNPALLGPDRIHATPEGDLLRAVAYANAARTCPPVT